jgi:truncated hemoglobin YjbI
MFRDLELQMKSFADFLYQRSGGGNQYTDRKGFIPIAESHAHLEIDEELAEKWLDVMEDSLDRCRQDFTEDQRQHLLDFMRYTAYEIIVWGRYRKSIIKKGPQF